MSHKIVGLIIVLALLSGFIAIIPHNINIVHSQDNFDVTDYRTTIIRMLGAVSDAQQGGGNRAIFDAVMESGDPLYIAPLIDLAFFTRGTTIGSSEVAEAIFESLGVLTEQGLGNVGKTIFDGLGNRTLNFPHLMMNLKDCFFQF